jgi:hypothetical protein
LEFKEEPAFKLNSEKTVLYVGKYLNVYPYDQIINSESFGRKKLEFYKPFIVFTRLVGDFKEQSTEGLETLVKNLANIETKQITCLGVKIKAFNDVKNQWEVYRIIPSGIYN